MIAYGDVSDCNYGYRCNRTLNYVTEGGKNVTRHDFCNRELLYGITPAWHRFFRIVLWNVNACRSTTSTSITRQSCNSHNLILRASAQVKPRNCYTAGLSSAGCWLPLVTPCIRQKSLLCLDKWSSNLAGAVLTGRAAFWTLLKTHPEKTVGLGKRAVNIVRSLERFWM